EEIRPVFDAESITVHDSPFRPATFGTTAIGNVKSSLLLGGLLVAVVLFLFLYNVRTAFISITAIPSRCRSRSSRSTTLSTVLNLLVLPTLAYRYARFNSSRGKSRVSPT